MPRDRESALKGVATRKEKFGEDYQAKIGSKGGTNGKGWKHSKATRRKISESIKLRNQLRKMQDENN